MANPQTTDWAAPPPPATPSPVAGPELHAIGPRVAFDRDAAIFAEGDPADHLFQVLSGVVRTCRILGDGRRQIEEFHLAGEYFGLELGDFYTCDAEAVGHVTVIKLRRAPLVKLAARDVTVAHRLLKLSLSGLARSQKHVAMLGRKGAGERLAAFLIDFAQRNGTSSLVDLPVSRQEIGDYLGLTIETVSRTFGQLEAEGVITVTERRRILLRDPQRLRSLCE